MGSVYIQSGEYSTYGLPATTTAAQVQQASAYVNGWLKRPEGVVWSPDAAGNPCYMAGLMPSDTWMFPAQINPGASVSVSAPAGRILSMDLIGQAVILDRANAGKTEATMITNVDQANGKVVFGSVAHEHDAGSLGEFGLTIFEERSLPAKRSMIRLSRPGACRLVSGVGRYGYGRRSDQMQGMYNEINLLATLQTFGGPPQWIAFDVTQASISPTSSELWVPAGILLAYYTDVRAWYLAGFPSSGIPEVIKQATAAVANFLIAMPPEMLAGGIKKMKAGDTEIDRFTSDLFSQPQYALLSSYRANALG